ncbi:MAG: homoserine dehydrogenase [Clostridiales bacterium]|nr:homoserine dehydrogenase [Clostridiales bacterium]
MQEKEVLFMYVAIMGYGVVGSGVAELFMKNHESIVSKSTQSKLELKYILDIRDFKGDPYEDKIVNDVNIIINDPEVGIVVETMGGLHPAYEFVSSCLEAGKSVVSSNKELVAVKGRELLALAEKKNVNFLFEASVGGGIPIIRPISQCLAANEIEEVAGILNGTTNFILTKMISDGMSFEAALKLAQENGYAERNPAADVEGTDACRKICILASLCFGKHVYPDSVHTEGITAITLADVEYARSWGGVIKLIACTKRIDENHIYAMVSPAFVSKHCQLAGVDDVFNAILVRGDAIGDVVFYGRGAGKLPTASAVVADIIDCAKHSARKKVFGWGDAVPDYVVSHLENETALYVRAFSEASDKLLGRCAAVFGKIETLAREGAPDDEIAFVTPRGKEGELREKLASIAGLEPASVIRVTDY